MQAVVSAGAGRLLRQDAFNAAVLRADISALLDNPTYRAGARQVATWFSRYPAAQRFTQLLEEIRPN
jgi:UDP:flavonoid glycosyltransferase YjiC (YdhE family)